MMGEVFIGMAVGGMLGVALGAIQSIVRRTFDPHIVYRGGVEWHVQNRAARNCPQCRASR